MSKARIRKTLPTPLSIPSVEGPYGKSSVLMHIHGFDFLDDVNNMPTANDILNREARIMGFDPEDWATNYRANRDRFLKAENEYILATQHGSNRLMTTRTEFYTGFGDGSLRSNNHEGARKAPNLMPTWSFNDPLKFSSVIPTEAAVRNNMSIETMGRWYNIQNFGSDSYITKYQFPEYEMKTFSHSTITSPGGTSIVEKYSLNSGEYPSVVLPNGDLLFYGIGNGYITETGESLNGLCVQDVETGLISNFQVTTVGGTSVSFNEFTSSSGDHKDISLFVSNGNIFLSFNNKFGSPMEDTAYIADGPSINSRLFKISLDGVIDETFFPTVFRYDRLYTIKNELLGSKNEELGVKNGVLPYLTYVNQSVAGINSLTSEITALGSTGAAKSTLLASKQDEKSTLDDSLNSIATPVSGQGWVANEGTSQEEVDDLVALINSIDQEVILLINEISLINSQIDELIEQRGYNIQDRDANLDYITANSNYPSKTEGYTQAEIDAFQASIDALIAEISTLNDEVNSLNNAIGQGLHGMQKFNALVNVHYIAGTTGASATDGSYYLAFDKLDEYGPLEAENNEYWEPISIGLLKVNLDGSNPTAIFKEDVIFCPRTEDAGLGDMFEFSTGNVKKSLMLSSGDFILYTAETQNEGYGYGYFPKFIKVSKEGVVDLSFTIDGYADSLYDNAAEMTPALDYSRLKVSVQRGWFRGIEWYVNNAESNMGVNGMIEMSGGKILFYGSFANILTGFPIGNYEWDSTHNIYDVGCFAVLNADGSLDTTFNNTAELSAEYYPIVQNAPAPWDNGKSFRASKSRIAPVGFQYAGYMYNDSSNPFGKRNSGSLEITFAKIIGNKLYVSLRYDGSISYNKTHIIGTGKVFRINLNDLTLDETLDIKTNQLGIRDLSSTPNGIRFYMNGIEDGGIYGTTVEHSRWFMNNRIWGMTPDSLNSELFNFTYLMKVEEKLSGRIGEPIYYTNSSLVENWNFSGDNFGPTCTGNFIFEMDEVNKGQISYHVPNETIRNIEDLVFNGWSTRSEDNEATNLYVLRSKYSTGGILTKSESDRLEVYNNILRERYTNEYLWADLASFKVEPVDGVSIGWTPGNFPHSTGLFSGEYSLSEVLPEFLNHVGSVPNMNAMKGYTASNGDVMIIDGLTMIHVNGSWIDIDNTNLADWHNNYRAARDAKLKAFNEIVLSIKPFTYAAYHIPKANLDDYIQSL